MPRLVWGAVGERYFETGVDRGVLYVGSDPGVAWNGLISVSESPSGGDPKPYYLDGIKYLNIAAAEEFEATLDAFSAPREFGPCDGMASIQNGLIATQQPRKSFGLSYRTLIGNDLDGAEHGYRIHLVYNALAEPSQRSHKTYGDQLDVADFSWSITTLPPSITGYKPTAHLIVDSTLADPDVLISVENILYGDNSHSARMPAPDELTALFA
jgi:hypothetical protein